MGVRVEVMDKYGNLVWEGDPWDGGSVTGLIPMDGWVWFTPAQVP